MNTTTGWVYEAKQLVTCRDCGLPGEMRFRFLAADVQQAREPQRKFDSDVTAAAKNAATNCPRCQRRKEWKPQW